MLPRRPRSPPPPPEPDVSLAHCSTIYTITPAHAARAAAASAASAPSTAGYTLNTAHQIRIKAMEAERAHARLDQPMPRFVMPAFVAVSTAESPGEPESAAALPFPAEPLPLFPSIHLAHQSQPLQAHAARLLGPSAAPAAAAAAAPFVYGDVLAHFPGRTPIAMQRGSCSSNRGGGGSEAVHAASTASFASSSASAAAASGLAVPPLQPSRPPLLNPITSPHSYTPSVAHLSRAPGSHAKAVPSFTAHRRATTHPHPRDRPSYRPELAAHPERSGPAVSSAMLLQQHSARRAHARAPSASPSSASLSSRGWLHSTRVDRFDSAHHRKLRVFDEELLFGPQPQQHQPPHDSNDEEKQNGSAAATVTAASSRPRRHVAQSASEALLAATILAHAEAARKSRPLAERKNTVRRGATGVPIAAAAAGSSAAVP